MTIQEKDISKDKNLHAMVDKLESMVKSICCGTDNTQGQSVTRYEGFIDSKDTKGTQKLTERLMNKNKTCRDGKFTDRCNTVMVDSNILFVPILDMELRELLDGLMNVGAKVDTKCGQAWDDYFTEDDRRTESTAYFSALDGEVETKSSQESSRFKGQLSNHEQTEKLLAATAGYNTYIGSNEKRQARSLLDDEVSPGSSPRNDMVDKSKSHDGRYEMVQSGTFDILVRNKQAELRAMLAKKDHDGKGTFHSELEILNNKITAAIDKFHLASPKETRSSHIIASDGASKSFVEKFEVSDTSVEEWSMKSSKSQLSYGDEAALHRIETKDSTMDVPKFGVGKFSESYKYFSPEKVPSVDTAAEIEQMDKLVAEALQIKFTEQDRGINSSQSFSSDIPDRSPSISPFHPDLFMNEVVTNNSLIEGDSDDGHVEKEKFENAWAHNSNIGQATEEKKEEELEDRGTSRQSTFQQQKYSAFSSPSPRSNDTSKEDPTQNLNGDATEKHSFKAILLTSETKGSSSSNNEDSESQNSYEADNELVEMSPQKNMKIKNSSMSVATDTSSVTDHTTRTLRSNTCNIFNITRLSVENQVKMDHSMTELAKVIFRESKIQLPPAFIILPYELELRDGEVLFDKDLALDLGERFLDVIRASSFIRRKVCSEEGIGDGIEDYSRNLDNLRRSIEKMFKLYSQYEMRLYLVDEYDGFPVIPSSTTGSPYPLKISYDHLQTLFPLMHLCVLLSRTWNGLDGLARILTGNQLTVNLSLAWTPANGAKETKFDPVLHTDEIRVIREALKIYSSSIYHKEKAVSPEITCLTKLLTNSDATNHFCSLVRVVDGWGSTLWTSAENLAEMREDASPENLLHSLNRQEAERKEYQAKEESVSIY